MQKSGRQGCHPDVHHVIITPVILAPPLIPSTCATRGRAFNSLDLDGGKGITLGDDHTVVHRANLLRRLRPAKSRFRRGKIVAMPPYYHKPQNTLKRAEG